MNNTRKILGSLMVLLVAAITMSSNAAFGQKQYTLTTVASPTTSPATVTATFTNVGSSNFNSLNLLLPTTNGYSFAQGATVSSSSGIATFLPGGIQVTSIVTPTKGSETLTVTMTGVTTSGQCGAAPNSTWTATVYEGSSLNGTQFALKGPAATTGISPLCYTLTYIAGPNGSITGASTQAVQPGGNGTAVTAVPSIGYHFVNWSDGSTANPRMDSNVAANLTVTANFAINTYLLTYTAGAGGMISGTSPQTVAYGSNGMAVTPVPNNTYRFVNWSDGSTANPRTDTNVKANLIVTANFAQNQLTILSAPASVAAGTSFNIRLSLNGGPLNVNVTVSPGSGCMLTPPTSFAVTTSPMNIPVTIAPTNPPGEQTCTLNVSANSYQGATLAPLLVYAGVLSCGDSLSASLTNPNGLSDNAPGWSGGYRSLYNKDGGSCAQGTAVPVNYDFANNVFSNNPALTNSVQVTWDTGTQPYAAFSYTANWQPEDVGSNGWPQVAHHPSLAWIFDANNNPIKIAGQGCLAPYAPKVYGTLDTAVGSGAGSIMVDVTTTPPATPFAIQIDSEQLTVTMVSGSAPQTWMLAAPTGTSHAAMTQVVSRLPSLPEPYGVLAAPGIGAGNVGDTVTFGVTLSRDVPQAPFPIIIGTERFNVTNVAGSMLTATRGDGMTTPASHSTGAPVMSTPLPLISATLTPPAPAQYIVGTPAHMCIWDQGFTAAGFNPLTGNAQVFFSTSVFDIGDGFMSKD